jgi:fimbrial isopeptide formation D2 family protein
MLKRKIGLVMTLMISNLLIASAFGVIVNNIKANEQSLEVVKDVWNESGWVNEINADNGDTVTFRITVTYHNVTQPQYQHYAENISIDDKLPDGLEYVVGSAEPFEPDISGNILIWDLGSTILYDDQSYVITFNATINSDEGQLTNFAQAEADEHCTSLHITSFDIALVNVNVLNPCISVEKYVFNGCNWTETVIVEENTDVIFEIVVENIGDADLEVYVNDTFPDGLEYNDSATVNDIPQEPTFVGDIFYWHFEIVKPNDIITIQFSAHVDANPCSENVNLVRVTGFTNCSEEVKDSDTATVIVNGECVQKQVWDGDSWEEETDANIGDIVSFKITVTYDGNLTLKQIKVKDELPECLEYVEGSAEPEEPEVSGDGITLWWNFSEEYNLGNGESLEITFDANVISNYCDPAENWVYVTGMECGVHPWYGEDSAIVNIGCELVADAGGPYTGNVSNEITITGSATGGKPPYNYKWDLDNDGQYDDATGAIITHSWNQEGTYIIWLKITDENNNTDTDYASVTIIGEVNKPPSKPIIYGQNIGKPGIEYEYTFISTDPDEDVIAKYTVNWGDGNNEIIEGPFESGMAVKTSHSWVKKGTYIINAKASDIHGLDSYWGTLNIKMPRNRILNIGLFEHFSNHFPILQKLLQRLG